MRRIVSRFGKFKTVNYVLGVTDVDDKIVAKADAVGVSWNSVAQKYEADFFLMMNKLRVLNPTVISRVSDNVDSIVEFINCLLEKGVAYVRKTGIYFSTTNYEGQGYKYGLFSGPRCSISGSTEEKEDLRDFALWKFTNVGWDSPWGIGRPGWHIECSANVSRWLGPSIDIHSGGIDLKFPHHENELAQSCARYGKAEWCRFFIHTGHVMVDGRKMSKSLNNGIFLKDLFFRHGYEEVRLFCLSEEYADPVRFTEDKLQSWRKKWHSSRNILMKVLRLQRVADEIPSSQLDFVNLLYHFNELTAEWLCDNFKWKPCIEFFFNTLVPKLDEALGKGSSISRQLLKKLNDTLLPFLDIIGLSESIFDSSEHEDSVTHELLHFRSQIRKLALENTSCLKESILNECDDIRLLLRDKHNLSIKDESIIRRPIRS